MADKQLLEQELSMAQRNKVTDHEELLTQCEALRTELLQQVSLSSSVQLNIMV